MLSGRQGLLKSGYRLQLSRSEFNVFALLPQTSFETLEKASPFTMPSSSEVSVLERPQPIWARNLSCVPVQNPP